MVDLRFFEKLGDTTLSKLVESVVSATADLSLPLKIDSLSNQDFVVRYPASLEEAGPQDISFYNGEGRYRQALRQTRAGACFITKNNLDSLPDSCIPLISQSPYHHFAVAGSLLYRVRETDWQTSCRPSRQGEGVVIGANVFIGQNVEIGAHTRIAPGVCIADGVRIGAHCHIGANVSIAHALIGDHVVLKPGACIGQTGFGFALGYGMPIPVPQLGRVILQDHVEIGAATMVDRGALGDTVIGEGSKLDNLIQIAHNVQIGRLCVLAGQSAIAGSVHIRDYVVIGGQTCIAGHLTVGQGARIAGGASVMNDVPDGATWGGQPARDIKTVFREVATVKKLAARKGE